MPVVASHESRLPDGVLGWFFCRGEMLKAETVSRPGPPSGEAAGFLETLTFLPGSSRGTAEAAAAHEVAAACSGAGMEPSALPSAPHQCPPPVAGRFVMEVRDKPLRTRLFICTSGKAKRRHGWVRTSPAAPTPPLLPRSRPGCPQQPYRSGTYGRGTPALGFP